MPRLSVNNANSVDGESFSKQANITSTGTVNRKVSEFPAALDATLTTRTDNDTGVLTFQTDPGIVVGQRLDLYWPTGTRRGMKASSIAGAGPTWTVTVGTAGGDVGVGDNLPPLNDPVTVGKVQSFDFPLVGNNMQALLIYAAAKAIIVIASGTDTEEYAAIFAAADVAVWYTGNGVANPLAGDTITKIFMSHGDSTSTREVKATALVN